MPSHAPGSAQDVKSNSAPSVSVPSLAARVWAVLDCPLSQLRNPTLDSIKADARIEVYSPHSINNEITGPWSATKMFLGQVWQAAPGATMARFAYAVGETVASVGTAVLFAQLVKHGGEVFPGLGAVVGPIGIAAVWLVGEALQVVRPWVTIIYSRSSLRALENHTLKELNKQSLESIQSPEQQTRLKRVQEDMHRVVNFTERNFQFVSSIASFLVAGSFLAVQQPVAALALLLCGAWQLKHEFSYARYADRTEKTTGELRRMYWWTRWSTLEPRGIRDTRNLGRMHQTIERVDQISSQVDQPKIADTALHAVRSVAPSLASVAVKGTVLASLAWTSWISGGPTAEVLGALFMLVPMEMGVRAAAKGFGEHALDYQYVKSLLLLLSFGKKEVDPQKNYVRPNLDVTPTLKLDKVSWAPVGKEFVIRNVTLEFEPGKLYGLCGPSGVGKTTLLRILTGELSPSEGRVLFGEHHRTDIHPDDARAYVMYMPQDVENFGGYRVVDAVRLGAPVRPQAARGLSVREVSQIAHIDFLDADRDYTTRVGGAFKDGREFSGGEIKRLAIARYLMRNSRILILDEPTAGLDSKSENSLLAAIRDSAKEHGCTLILVSHHYVNFKKAKADLVYYIGKRPDGDDTPIEIGTHESLMLKPDGKYRAMYEEERKPHIDD